MQSFNDCNIFPRLGVVLLGFVTYTQNYITCTLINGLLNLDYRSLKNVEGAIIASIKDMMTR